MSPNIDRLVELMTLDQLRPMRGNPRTHSKQQIQQIATSIQRFGFTNPLLVSDDMEGHCQTNVARRAQQW
jgi:ParB-like chromosome segregation protein Spo0J